MNQSQAAKEATGTALVPKFRPLPRLVTTTGPRAFALAAGTSQGARLYFIRERCWRSTRYSVSGSILVTSWAEDFGVFDPIPAVPPDVMHF